MSESNQQDRQGNPRPVHALKRWLTWLVAALFVIVPGWVVAEHFRGKVALDGALAVSEAKRLELLLAWAPQIPDGPGANGWAELVELHPRLTNLVRMRPPAILPVLPGRAVSGHRLDWWGLTRDVGTNSWAAFGRMLEAHRAEIEGVHRAMSRPVRQAPVKASDADEDWRGPVLRVYRGAGAVVESAGLESLRRGDVSGALRAVAELGVLEADLALRPTWSGHRMRRMDALSAANLRMAIIHSGLATEAELRELMPIPAGERRARDLVRVRELSRARVIRVYRAMSYADLRATLGSRWMRSSQERDEGTAPAAHAGSGFGVLVAEGGEAWHQLRKSLRDDLVFPIWRFGWGDLALARCLEEWDGWGAEVLGAAARRSWAALDVGRDKPLRQENSYRDRWASVLSADMRDLELDAFKGVFQLELLESMNSAAIALKRHELRHGSLPETLAALVPEFLPEIPVDWMTGLPLRYQRGEDGEFLLQSVGLNLRDDSTGEVSTEDLFAHLGGDDEVWLLPLTESQRARLQNGEVDRRARVGGIDPSLARRYGLVPPGNLTMKTNAGGRRAVGVR